MNTSNYCLIEISPIIRKNKEKTNIGFAISKNFAGSSFFWIEFAKSDD